MNREEVAKKLGDLIDVIQKDHSKEVRDAKLSEVLGQQFDSAILEKLSDCLKKLGIAEMNNILMGLENDSNPLKKQLDANTVNVIEQLEKILNGN